MGKKESDNKRTLICIALLLVALIILIFVSRGCQPKNRPDILNPPKKVLKKKEECPPSSLSKIIPRKRFNELRSHWSYLPKDIEVSRGQTIEEAVLDAYPDCKDVYGRNSFKNFGGPKLIAEMSADRAGYYFSQGPASFHILPLDDLHLKWVDDEQNIFLQVLAGNVSLTKVEIPYALFSFKCGFELENNQDDSLVVVFPAGQMIETAGQGVQNVVVSRTEEYKLAPRRQYTISVPIFCAAQHRGNPQGYPARVTPFMLDVDPQGYQNQSSIWSDIETREVTFYAWRSGDRTQSGTSKYGHAFVRLSGVGVFGFSAKHRGKKLLLGEEGLIFDHSELVKFATDSCRIRVSESQMTAMVAKLNELQRNVPQYELGRYDCTSFVMDIADAGRINYGYRDLIQWPISFIGELKAHN